MNLPAVIVSFTREPETAMTLARNDFVFYGKTLEEIASKYEIPKSFLAEQAFKGKDSWIKLRSKVQEDSLDSLLNQNLFVLNNNLNNLLVRVDKFLKEEKNLQIKELEDVERVMKISASLTKALQVCKKIREVRDPGKKIKEALALEGLEGDLDSEDSEDNEAGFIENYGLPAPKKQASLEDREQDIIDSLDVLL